jgi:hypothetical protein
VPKLGEQSRDVPFTPLKRGNERNVVNTSPHVAARSPVIDGPCGCHPP